MTQSRPVELAELKALAARAESAGQVELASILHALIASTYAGVEGALMRHIAPFTREMIAAINRLEAERN